MNDFCVMYNNSDVIWVPREQVEYHESFGFKVYGYAKTEKEADKLAEEACYL